MFYMDADDPYVQPPLPYQPYLTHTDPSLSQEQKVVSPATRPLERPSPAYSSRSTPVSPRLSKAEALEFVRTCKKWLIAGSIVVFGVLSGLVAAHVTGVTSAAPASNTPATSPSTGGGFFQQQQGGYNFGSGNFQQPPVSGSRVS